MTSNYISGAVFYFRLKSHLGDSPTVFFLSPSHRLIGFRDHLKYFAFYEANIESIFRVQKSKTKMVNANAARETEMYA